MKKPSSIKTRITIWYTSLMLVLIAVVLAMVGTLSYRLATDNIEKDIKLQVTQISEKISKHQIDVFRTVDNNREFKNVSLYEAGGKYITGQYIYDIASIEFKEGPPRREIADNKEYVVYDVFKRGAPGGNMGFWIRGAESVNSTILIGKSAIMSILVLIPLILLLAVLGGYYITKKAFRPINGIIKTANEISEQNDISRRIRIESGAIEDEMYNLAYTLNNMLDEIENLVKKEKQFTSDASHELRTPISVILAQGEYLADIAENEKEKELAEDIVLKAKQVSKLVSSLLLLARIDQSRQRFNKEKVDLSVLVDIAIDGVCDMADKNDIRLESQVSEGLMVDADETLLLSVLTNLISNGIKYGKRGGYVFVSALKTGAGTEIIVKDDGVGIDEEHIDKIWDRFYRVDDVRNDEYSSYGLGLAMTKSIINLHDGDITVKSEPEQGSEFKIVLKNTV